MKEAIITDLSGRYIEPTLVADSVTGVLDRRERVEPDEPGALSQPEPEQRDDEQPDEPETVHVGYTVAVPMPDGLYQPIFDVEGYRAAQEAYETAYVEYMTSLAEHDPESDDPQPVSPQPIDGASYWRNGLTDEEIEALNPPPQPSQTDMLGQELTQMKIRNIQQQSVIDGLGRELTESRLDNMKQKQTVDSLGSELTKAKLEIIQLKGGQSS
ncbi:hypothetical protein WJ0W_005815 [Paenibacillus melissococcoides]|uniref:Bacteriophage SP-beta YorD domain-containing protein n=1 Tax=Paenibacillus melissococcoides TaxID=2912268 RepID=A0ABN8UBS1_9BACL|nr:MULTISPECIES: hypothetical protein [Paenibacillus]MEB9892697.1 hypothetical protein [Bacillus cereus]CAH8248631.1 hypothetical protein WJ0W_005815 [Paenibacillus melissococcoides]CAH8714193.1 hypothetical protein WDD9_003797 [Paenibacillus melissococcoides]CAH8720040.1 hypothetical protein HTL2_005810 [Paenibacillus melissococcoides]GIO81492.1 hypothetical protein J6TS7_51020 [Paenibacillus dendritiformis]